MAVTQRDIYIRSFVRRDVVVNAEDTVDSLHHIPRMHRQEFRHFKNDAFPPIFSMHGQAFNQKANCHVWFDERSEVDSCQEKSLIMVLMPRLHPTLVAEQS